MTENKMIDDLGRSVELAAGWFTGSQIQDNDEKAENHGSFRAWYDMDRGAYTYPYAEITGYALTTLSYLETLGKDPAHTSKGELATSWLDTRARDQKHGGFRCRYIDGGFHTWLCSFDNSMILNGLVNFHRMTGEKRYLELALELGDWLLDFMLKDSGVFHAKFDTATGSYIETQERWSTQSGSFLAKNVIGLINLSQLTGEEKYAEAGRGICDLTLEVQQPDGRFVTNQRLADTYMHPHNYAIEGLIAAWLHFGDEHYLTSCYRAADWIKTGQLPNGAVSRIFDSKNFSTDISTDSTAQSLRSWTLLSHYGDYEFPEKEASDIANFLLGMQCKEDVKNAYGGFFYGITDGKLVRHISDHGTMFTLQTLKLYEEMLSGSLDFKVRYLI